MDISQTSPRNPDNTSGRMQGRQHADQQYPANLDIYMSLGAAFSFQFNATSKRISVFSSEVYNVLGYHIARQELHLLSFIKHLHPEDIQPLFVLLRKIKQCLQYSDEYNPGSMKLLLDFRVKHAGGKYVRLLLQTQVREAANPGTDKLWIGLTSDISFLKMDGKLSFYCLNADYQHKLISTDLNTARSNGLFSSREREVLKLLAKGYDSRSIEEALHISQHTVRTHRRNMHKKCNVENTVQLIKLAIREGYV